MGRATGRQFRDQRAAGLFQILVAASPGAEQQDADRPAAFFSKTFKAAARFTAKP